MKVAEATHHVDYLGKRQLDSTLNFFELVRSGITKRYIKYSRNVGVVHYATIAGNYVCSRV